MKASTIHFKLKNESENCTLSYFQSQQFAFKCSSFFFTFAFIPVQGESIFFHIQGSMKLSDMSECKLYIMHIY